jgi:hypothetical protein
MAALGRSSGLPSPRARRSARSLACRVRRGHSASLSARSKAVLQRSLSAGMARGGPFSGSRRALGPPVCRVRPRRPASRSAEERIPTVWASSSAAARPWVGGTGQGGRSSVEARAASATCHAHQRQHALRSGPARRAGMGRNGRCSEPPIPGLGWGTGSGEYLVPPRPRAPRSGPPTSTPRLTLFQWWTVCTALGGRCRGHPTSAPRRPSSTTYRAPQRTPASPWEARALAHQGRAR